MNRRTRALTAGLAALFLCAPLSTTAMADGPTTVTLATPTALSMTITGTATAVTPGGWINHGRIDLHFQLPGNTASLTPQIEIEPAKTAFTGQPTTSGAPVTGTSAVVTAGGLQNGIRYHWAARVEDAAGNAGGWVSFAGAAANSVDFGVDTTPPARPVIRSSTNPNPNRWYNASVVRLSWNAADGGSGVAGYTYVLERNARVIPPGSVTTSKGATITNLGNGTWFLALRAEDAAGNWSPTATFRMQIDRQPARLTWLSPRRFVLNPYRGGATVRFRVDSNVTATAQLFRVGTKAPVATFSFPHLAGGHVATIAWNGRLHGKIAPRGYYFFFIRLVDRANNITRLNEGGINLTPLAPVKTPAGPLVYPDGGKIIIVSLAQQTLYAYDGSHLALQTYVTTGNPALPTPPGNYSVLEKLSPFEFISPWPQGSPYYYAPSWVKYAMLFRAGGYFLHDAPWRSAFGPGTNGAGTPGTNYGGSHGCVNIPPSPMTFLWNWTPEGTPVDVVP